MQKPRRMQESEFEKQVQQKMEELKFSPSESVWPNIEKEIKKEKKRRMPLLWFFLLLGLAVSGYYFFKTRESSAGAHIQTPAANTNNSKKSEQPTANTEKTGAGHSAPVSGRENNHNGQLPQSNALLALNRNTQKKAKSKNTDRFISDNKSEDKSAEEPAANAHESHTGNSEETAAKDNEPPAKAGSADSTAAPAPIVKKADSAIAAKPETKKDSTQARQKKTKKRNPWKIGFTGAGGIAAVQQSLFNSAHVPSPYFDNVQALGYAQVHYPSDIKPGFSFAAGAFASKKLSNRLSLSVGLNYHYYSTGLRTGNKVLSAASASYLSAYSLSPTAANAYYNNGTTNKYTGHYHLLELPVALQYQLNRSKKWPLFWEAGVAVSELLGTDALYFNYSTGVYYKNDKSFNKTQFSGSTALMAGFVHGRTLFTLGPQLQYGFTNLINDKTIGKEHLFFGGIKFTIIPKWKK